MCTRGKLTRLRIQDHNFSRIWLIPSLNSTIFSQLFGKIFCCSKQISVLSIYMDSVFFRSRKLGENANFCYTMVKASRAQCPFLATKFSITCCQFTSKNSASQWFVDCISQKPTTLLTQCIQGYFLHFHACTKCTPLRCNLSLSSWICDFYSLIT